MTAAILAALAGAPLLTGILVGSWGLRRTPVDDTVPARAPQPCGDLGTDDAVTAHWVLGGRCGPRPGDRRPTGWVVASVLVPAAVVGFPYLLGSGHADKHIDRLEAMEEWTRSLAGVLTAGVGLEQA